MGAGEKGGAEKVEISVRSREKEESILLLLVSPMAPIALCSAVLVAVLLAAVPGKRPTG